MKLNEKISGALKSIRSERGWSLDVASQKTGVSKAMLGQIERGESSPTISTLWKIASGFDVSFSYFIEELRPTDSQFIHRSSNLKQLHKQDDKINVMPIFPYDEHLGFEIFIIELLPRCEHMSHSHQKGVVEHVVVVSGEIEVFADDAWQIVKQHEGLRFNADKPHGYRNRSSKVAVFHDMIHYRRL